MPDEPMTAPQVIMAANRLRDSAAMQGYRKNITFYRNALTTKNINDLPEPGQGTRYTMNSPDGLSLRKSLRSKIRSYSTYVTVSAFNLDGAVTKPLRDKEDKLERWDTLLLDTLDDGGVQTNLCTDYQLGDPYAVLRLRRLGKVEAAEKGTRYALECIDGMICHFRETIGGAFRPKRFAMRYKMTVAEAFDRWEALEGPFSDKKLRYDGKKFELVPLEDARPLWGDNAVQDASGKDPLADKDCEFISYEDGKFIYQVIMLGSDTASGEVVWYEKCTTGGVQAVIVPGDINTAGGPGERMIPFLMAYIIWLVQLDAILELRATLALRERPDVFINVDPDRFDALKLSGGIIPATPEQMSAKGPGIIAVNGEPTMWAAAPNPDLNELATYIAGRLDREAARYQTITDPNVVQQSTAEAFFISSGASDVEQVPLLTDRAKALAMILDMVHADIENTDGNTPDEYKDGYALYAAKTLGRARGGEIKSGEAVSITAADLDFKPGGKKVSVATKQETEAQRERRSNQMALQVQQRVSTPEEHVASLYPDTMGQLVKLAKADAYREAGQIMATWPMQLVVEEARLSGGSRVLIPQEWMGGNGQGNGASSAPNTYKPTATEGAAGASNGAYAGAAV